MNLKTLTHDRRVGSYLAAAFSALTIVLTVILLEVIGVTATAQIKSNIGNGLAELATQTADKLDRGMFERYREVQLMTKRQDIISQAASIETKRDVLDARQETYHYYAWIGLTDLSGKVVAATQKMLEGEDVSKRPWFRNALDGIHVGDVHEAVLLARLLKSSSGEPPRFVDIAFPYLDSNGRIQGVLGVHLSWQWAREVEQSVMEPIAARRQVEAMIVGADGKVLLGPPALQGKALHLNSFKASTGGTGFMVERWDDGSEYLVGYSKSKGYGPYPGLGWTVLVRQGLEDAYQPVRRIQKRVLWSGIGLAVLFSLLGLIAARRISRPLRELADSARRIQNGEATQIASDNSDYAEVKALAGALNTLVSDLLQKKEDLRELNQTLEKRVEQRTRELEHALVSVRANEKRIQSIIEAAQDAFIAVDLNGNITDWNSAAERMFGWRSEEAIGKSLDAVILPPRYRESFLVALQRFNATGETGVLSRRLERIVVNRHGEEIPVEVTVGLAGTQETYFFSAFLHDISERRQIEQMKNEFISTVSHELRTPMTSIRASLSLLADGGVGELSPDTKELVDIAYNSCERLVRLVNDVLDIAKMDAGNMTFQVKPQPLLPLVEKAFDAVRGQAEQYQVELELQQDAEGLVVNVDGDRIVQAIVNLLDNAIKFSPAQSTVTLRASSENGRARIDVIDRGKGIPDSFRNRIFQRFAQADATDSRQKGGTGLGLNICKRIMEAHHGTIGYTSEMDRGTVFQLTLPLTAEA